MSIVEDQALSYDFGVGLEAIGSSGITIHTVQNGETLSEIAEYYDISINTIKWENNITGNSIKVGQKLNILPTTGVKHTIKKGDTISKIAEKYDAEAEDILVFNGIDKSDGLKQGDIIFVPNGVIKTVVIQKSPSPSGGSTITSTLNVEPGYYIAPTRGRITSRYGSRRGGFHYGVDIGNSRGTPVVASASGVVVESINYCVERKTSCGGRYGNLVTIEHSNGTKTRYAHLQRSIVNVGQTVSQGEQIGTLGNTGRSTGPHLHFEVIKNNGTTIRPPVY